jgi:hypothetical protein
VVDNRPGADGLVAIGAFAEPKISALPPKAELTENRRHVR